MEVILRLAPQLVVAALLASGCGTQRAGDTAPDQPHSRQTLQFFGLRPDMTVVEVWPGGGEYTQILAPLLRNRGRLYAANLDPASSEYARRTVDDFRAKLAAHPDLYDKVVVTALAAPPARSEIAPAGSADLVVTFHTLHNWMMFGWQREAFAAMHAALKPGGVLGIVEHRGDPNRPQDPKAASGYVHEQYAIDLIESVGFKLVGRSQLNANPRDTKDYEKGVWALPPTFAGGAVDHDRYAAIGESDRFTLKFVKVEK
ncbi:MAG TPA: methyltransferase domain-containing protein [Steroidobacteraceae bacterium]|nr:methyltransferase domain-containing protein [Steroidobacteraceae bacterium]